MNLEHETTDPAPKRKYRKRKKGTEVVTVSVNPIHKNKRVTLQIDLEFIIKNVRIVQN